MTFKLDRKFTDGIHVISLMAFGNDGRPLAWTDPVLCKPKGFKSVYKFLKSSLTKVLV